MAEKKGTSPWVWVGCGCIAAIVLLIALVLGAGFFGVQALKGYVEDLENPEVRETKVLEILGADALPEGLNAQMFFSVPFVMDMLILSDAPSGGGQDIQTEDLGERALFFLSMRNLGGADQDLEKLLQGDTGQLDLDIDLDFRSRGDLGRGAFDLDNQQVRWAAHLGAASGKMDRVGIYTIFLVECKPDDDKLRMAYYWDQIESSTAEEGTEVEGAEVKEITTADVQTEGTPADELVLKELLGQFRLCG